MTKRRSVSYGVREPHYEELALRRVANRVKEGGHNVPEPDVRRRFKRGLVNYQKLYRGIVDYYALFDNSSVEPKLVERGKNVR